MEEIRTSETSVYSESTRHYIPESYHLHTRRRKNLKSSNIINPWIHNFHKSSEINDVVYISYATYLKLMIYTKMETAEKLFLNNRTLTSEETVTGTFRLMRRRIWVFSGTLKYAYSS
jgi:hypothetical protein